MATRDNQVNLSLWGTPEQRNELKKWLTNHGIKSSQALPALLGVLKLSDGREQIPERGAELDTFQNLLNQIMMLYQESLLIAQNAEHRVRDEFHDRIVSTESSVTGLKEKVVQAENERDEAKVETASWKEKVEFLQKQITVLQQDNELKAAALKDKTELNAALKARLEANLQKVNDAEKMATQCDDLAKKVLELEKELITKEKQEVQRDVHALILNNQDSEDLLKKFRKSW